MNTPKIRFKGFTDDWEQRKVGEVTKELLDYDNFSSGLPLLTSSRSGLMYQSEYRGNATTENENTLFSVVPLNACTYRHMSDDSTFHLNINTLEKGLVSKEYPVFQENESNLKFIVQYINSSNSFTKFCTEQKKGGTRTRLYYKTLCEYKLMMPSIKEQNKTANFFDTLDHLITLHQRKCDETKQLKKFMLQKMFPKNGEKNPEIRFKGFTDDWEQRKLGEMVIDHNAGIYISKEDYGEGTNVIGVGNIYDRDIFDGEIYRLGPVNDDKFILEENDIIYGESSLVPEGIARTVCVGKNGAGSAFAWHTRRVKLDKNIVNSHVATLELNYLHEIRKYLVSVSTQTALTGMTTEGYFGATLTLPSVEEQQVISDYFKNIDYLITLHQRKCEKLKELKKFMLQNMFV